MSYPEPMDDISSSVLITPLEVTYAIEPHQDDSKTATVKIGEMRLALVTSERYEAAVVSQNDAVAQNGVLIEDREIANSRINMAREIGIHNSLVAALVGVVIGCSATSILFFLAR